MGFLNLPAELNIVQEQSATISSQNCGRFFRDGFCLQIPSRSRWVAVSSGQIRLNQMNSLRQACPNIDGNAARMAQHRKEKPVSGISKIRLHL